MEYKANQPISAEQFIDVLTRSTLAERRPVDVRNCIEGMLEHANLTVTAWDGDKLVGIVPFHLIRGGEDAIGCLQWHLARANPVWQRVQDGARVLAVFQGPNAYISPSWYPTKVETGRVVPTWNYLAVHVQGAARIVEDSAQLARHVRDLTDRHEAAMGAPWSADDAPAEFTERLLYAIVGVEIAIEALSGKLKASQNQPGRNREGVRRGLEGSDGTQAQSMATFLEPKRSADR